MVSWWWESLLRASGASKEIRWLVSWRCCCVRGSAMVGCAISAVSGWIKLKPGVIIQHIIEMRVMKSDNGIVWGEVMILSRFGGGNGGIDLIPTRSSMGFVVCMYVVPFSVD